MKHSHTKQTYGYRKISRDNNMKKKRGYNSYKYSVYSGVENDINILDLKGVSLNQTKDLLMNYIKFCIKNKGVQ